MTAANSVTSVSMPDDSGEDFATLFASQQASTERLHPGQKVSGTVIEIAGENIFLNVGVKLDGIIERKDLLNAEGELTVKEGDSVEAYVVSVSSEGIRLSRSMSGSGMAALEEARDAGVPVDGRVTATCKGGYSVEVMGKRAFCPGSQMDMTSQDDPESMVGRTMQFIVTTVESRGRNIVVSRRALQERERQESLATLLDTLKVGDMLDGTVTRLAAFGAFVEIAPSVEGMVHVSELSWARIGAPDEAVSVGDKIRVKLLSVGKDAKGNTRIALSRRQAEGDPWENVGDSLSVGSVVQGKVVRLMPFGAFVEVLPGVEGLVHVSEMSWTRRVNKPEEMVQVGDSISVKVKELSQEKRRVSLSMRDAEGDPWAQVEERFPVGSEVTGTVEGRAQFGVFVTLAPGITGLLPNGAAKGSSQNQALSKLNKGDSVTLRVQSVDVAQRRISLAPEDAEAQEQQDTSWKKHAAAAKAPASLGIMAQALQDAMKKKQ